jgi:serine/threonine-protein kinase
MLDAHDGGRGLELERRLVDEREPREATAAAVGTLVGPYRLEAVVGEGGMGTVYRARRVDEDLHRHVAIKLVKRGMDSDEILRRFRHERRILASFEHPHIARLYDGGVSADGRPYLVMEYVEGTPITTYCDERRLGIDERLALFQTVCETVQCAHQSLVVHRDLKPANILVTAQGEPKLLDFGIAKLLDAGAPAESAAGAPEAGEAAPRTRTGVRLLTPEYASPEQVRGLPITTASDVYALGVVLYELLCGRRPHARAGRAAGEVERLVLEGDVERPSTVVVRRDDGGATAAGPNRTREEVAGARGTTPDRLRRRLRGDLDTIALTALARSARRRYRSAEQLAEDVRRHRLGLPVAARPDTRAYRAGKFVRRHRAGVAAGALALVSLVGGASAALWQAERAARERDAARDVAGFLEGLFQAADPYAAEGDRADTLRVADLLARGSTLVRRELGGQPEVQARLLLVLGRVHQARGRFELAQPLLAEALRLRDSLHDAPHPDLAESQNRLATVLRDRGELDAAEPLLRLALASRERWYGRRHAAVAETLNDLAILLRLRGRYDDAERQHLAALAILRETGHDPRGVITVLGDLVATLDEKGDDVGGERQARTALALSRATFGARHPRVALAATSLALALQRLGRYAEAESLAVEALAIGEAALGPEHPRVAVILGRLASIRFWQGDLAAAESAHRRSLAIRRRVHGPTHLETTDAMYDLAQVLRAQGDLDGAEALNRESLAIVRRRMGPDHPLVAVYLTNLAATLEARGDCRGAEPVLREAIAGMRRTLSADRHRVPLAQRRLGSCLASFGRYAEAETLLVASLAVLRETLAADDERVRDVEARLAALYAAWGRR